ncbi:MAG: hypothetical protein SF052_06195 [Bacteroidia bacterium]|nr:hypothetical protein [Bacteroidia bacterium]
MKKRSTRSAWIVCFVVVLCSVTQARIRIQGPADQQMLFLEMLQCAMYGTTQPAPGQIVADLSLAPSSIPPTVDSIKYGLINTLKQSYITNGIGQGLWQFDQSDACRICRLRNFPANP